MDRKRTVVATAALIAGALALTACSTNRTEAGGASSGSSCDTSKGTLVVGFVAPLSGGLSALGLGMKNSADLAVNEANQQCKVPGYKLALQAEDDQSTAQIAGQAATKLASDPNVVGVIGTLNSSTAQSVAPILAQKKIVEISPANTNPSLTQGDNAASPARPNATYFRVATTDAVQGPFAAQYLVGTAGKKKIAVIDDGKTYGAGLAAAFAAEAQKRGATIVASEKVGEKDTDFSGVISKIRPLSPDAVYYGGEYPVAGPLSKQLADAGLNIPLMGGDGIVDDTYASLGGREGDLATSVGAPAEQLPSAKAFIDAYNAAGYKEPFSTYGALTYDATNVLIAGVGKGVGTGTFGDGSRDAVLQAVQSTSMDGATGKISFDQFGDTTSKVLTIYQVKGGKFAPVESGEFKAS
ncbi:MAG: branched-chain amino acid ABC transporter substrate-binding protein [Pseudonocardia sp.]|nr:branched-chain amino acid ABC transporter substrate-binding protein [Pseudonocardia sp.]